MCEQRKRQLLFNIPPPRFTPINPYESGIYTKSQLDMRRKAEILQYNANSSNTKTNNLTKKEKWSQIVKGNYKGKTLYCTVNESAISTPTSSSGVPGPIVNLNYDDSIPLYNYSMNVDAYSGDQPDINIGWTVYPLDDKLCANETGTNIGSLYIRNNLDQYSYTYNISTPIAIYIKGTNINDIRANQTVQVKLDSIVASVTYNNIPVTLPNGGPICKINDTLITNQFVMDLSLSSATADEYTYSAYLYIGILNISNITLNTETGYIYDFLLNCNLTLTTTPSSIPNLTHTYGIVSNLTNLTQQTIMNNAINYNSTVTTSNSGIPYSSFALTAI